MACQGLSLRLPHLSTSFSGMQNSGSSRKLNDRFPRISMKSDVHYHKIYRDGIEWIVSEPYLSTIPGELVEIMRKVASHPGCQLLRDNNVRTSALVPLPGGEETVFVKRYKCRGLSDMLKYLFFTSKASAEWENMHRFLEKGMGVPLPIAKGEKRRFTMLVDSYLITGALVNATPLQHYLTNIPRVGTFPSTVVGRKSLIQKVAVLIRKIHDQGFFYRDLHAGNILVVESDAGELQLYPVDFHKIWYLKDVPLWMRMRDLAQLRNSIAVSRTEQVRFLREYGKGYTPLVTRFKLNARRLDIKAKKLWRTHLFSRTKRCLVNSSEFEVKRGIAQSLYRNRAYAEELLSEIMNTFHAAPMTGGLTILKETPKEKVAVITTTHKGTATRVIVKESLFPRWGRKVRYTFSRSRARKYWIAARGLKVRGIDTPDSLALIEQKRYGFPFRNFLVIEFIDHGYELNEYIVKNFKKVLSRDEVSKKRHFIRECARRVRSLHEQGVYHADLKSNNILVKEKDSGGWYFYFIDLDRVVFKRTLSLSERINNLAQINASVADCITPSDRLRFFKRYAQGTSAMEQREKYYQRILDISRTKVTHPYGVVFSPPAKHR